MTPTASILAAFTPTGKLRAAINLGNPILAAACEDGGARGVSVDLAREFARVLGVDLELVVVDAAAKSVDVVASEQRTSASSPSIRCAAPASPSPRPTCRSKAATW
jgi:polar amino acid transport system substrate-binding protein